MSDAIAAGQSRVYTCPYSRVEYVGPCPTTNCPANIAHVPDRGTSGCCHIFLGKIELSRLDVAYAFDVPITQVEQQVARGRRRIELYVLLLQCLHLVRQEKARHCEKCGVVRTTGGDCINVIKCEERSKFLDILLRQYPFKIEGAGFTKSDIFRLVHFRDKLHPIIAKAEVEADFRTVMQLRKTKFETLMSLAAVV